MPFTTTGTTTAGSNNVGSSGSSVHINPFCFENLYSWALDPSSSPPPSQQETTSERIRRNRGMEHVSGSSLSLNTRQIHRVRTVINDFESSDQEICALYAEATNRNRRGDMVPNGSQPENNDNHIGRHLDSGERHSIHHPEDDENLSEDSIEI